MSQKLYVVGIGPGDKLQMTQEAMTAIEKSSLICGYTVYCDLVRRIYPDKEFFSTTMTKEIDRCRYALMQACNGITTAMICSGDAGVYGMAGPILELAVDYPEADIEIVPGITAALSGGAVLGAPLTHDFCVISLSDLLTPIEIIEKRLRSAAEGDFGIAIYNPSSRKRADYLKKACDILEDFGKSPDTICGYVRNIGREGMEKRVLTLSELRQEQLDMFTTVFIGTSATKQIAGKMVTPRGYSGLTQHPDTASETLKNASEAADSASETLKNASEAADSVSETLKNASEAADSVSETLKNASEAADSVSGNTSENASANGFVIFGGTTEGRKLSYALADKGVKVTVCVATGYGSEAEGHGQNVNIHEGRLDVEGIKSVVKGSRCCIDATHPYAEKATYNIRKACGELNIPYIRLSRAKGVMPEFASVVTSSTEAAQLVADKEAAQYDCGRRSEQEESHTGSGISEQEESHTGSGISEQEESHTGSGRSAQEENRIGGGRSAQELNHTGKGNILITTGIKELPAFNNIECDRIYVRILPSAESIDLCEKAGIIHSHIIAMQGPFSEEMNTAIMKQYNIRYLVTKDGGIAGGFNEKAAACRLTGAFLIVIKRPDDYGICYEKVLEQCEKMIELSKE